MDWRELDRTWDAPYDRMVAMRRDLHRFPEAAWTELRTTSLVASRLAALGWDVRVGAGLFDAASVMGRPSEGEMAAHVERARTQGADEAWLRRIDGWPGVVAELDGGRPGPVVALRFDIDCVEVGEDRSTDHRPAREGFASENAGLMHSCGHDAHTAIGLGVAEMLSKGRGRSGRGKVRLIFQPGEEGCRGAWAMVQAGVVDDVDAFLALHVGGGVPTGTFGLDAVGYLATTKFDARFTGVSAHAAGAPHMGRDALLAAAAATLGLHSIAPHSDGDMRVGVGVLQAGTGRNVVPASALLKAETRGATQEVASYAYARAVEVIRGAAAMYGVDVELIEQGKGTTATGSPGLVRRAEEAVRALGAFDRVVETVRSGGSEDATWMMRRVQERGGEATYMALGSDIAAPHHSSRFDLDERSMDLGARAMVAITEALLAGTGR